MKISDLVNKRETFTFEYDGEKLTGEWYKYRTTTPKYLHALESAQQEFTTRIEEVDAQLGSVNGDNAKRLELETTKKTLLEQQERAGYQWLTDAILSWNAEDDEGNQLPPTKETFDQLPTPFVLAFGRFLAGLREGNPPNAPASQNG